MTETNQMGANLTAQGTLGSSHPSFGGLTHV